MPDLIKMARLLTDPVFMGKALAAGTQVLVVILAARWLALEEANLLYTLMALSAIVAAVGSFGANGALVPFLYRHPDRTFPVLSVLLGGKILTSALGTLTILALGHNQGLPGSLIAWTAFCSSLLFVDFVAESRGNVDVERISRIKFVVFGLGLLLKVIFFHTSFTMLLITLYAEWPVIWLIYFLRGRRPSLDECTPLRSDIILVARFLVSTSWVWLSAVISFGWTRAYFILVTSDIGIGPANAFFVVVRLIEGLMLIPNTLAMRFFPQMVAHQQQGEASALHALRIRFLRRTLEAALATALAVPLLLTAVYGWGVDSSNFLVLSPVYAVMIGAAAFMMNFRVALSREIILTGFLPLSIISYLAGAVASFGVYRLAGADEFGDALVGYLIFAIVSFVSPLLFSPERLRPFRNAIWAALKREATS